MGRQPHFDLSPKPQSMFFVRFKIIFYLFSFLWLRVAQVAF
jgi:hypothetical protein